MKEKELSFREDNDHSEIKLSGKKLDEYRKAIRDLSLTLSLQESIYKDGVDIKSTSNLVCSSLESNLTKIHELLDYDSKLRGRKRRKI